MTRAESKNSGKKKWTILFVLLLGLGSLGTYVTVHMMNARNTEQQQEKGRHSTEEQHKYKEAIISYNKALDTDKKNVNARIGLAKAYMALEQNESAFTVLREGINLLPKEPRFYIALSDAKLAMNDFLAAVQVLDEGYEKTKNISTNPRTRGLDSLISIVSDKEKVQVGHRVHLKAIYNNRLDKEKPLVKVKWSLENDDLGSLSQTESTETDFTATRVGFDKIIVKIGSLSIEKIIIIQKRILTKAEIQSSSTRTTVGKSVDLKVIGKDVDNQTMSVDPIWTIEKGSGSFSSRAFYCEAERYCDRVSFTPDQPGITKLTANVNGHKASVILKVDK